MLRSGLRPALILLDLMMPVLHGWATLEAIRSDPALRAATVFTFSASEQAAKADGHLRKPADVETLLAAVARVVGGSPGSAPERWAEWWESAAAAP